MDKEKLILIGGGGHCKSCIDVIKANDRYKIVGILDRPELIGQKVCDYEIIGSDNMISNYLDGNFSFLITVGQIRSVSVRKRLFYELKGLGAVLATVVSPLARVSQYAKIANGTIVMHGAMVNAGAEIGENVILNTACNIEHDVVVGNHCHISTHAVVNGNVTIGDGTFIGSNAVISNQVVVGSDIVIGAGSVVVQSLFGKGIYVGNPARIAEL